MYYNVCNGTEKPVPANSCVEANITVSYGIESDWPLERVVSMVVPVFFGIIGLCGLLGNALVIIGRSIKFIQRHSRQNVFLTKFSYISFVHKSCCSKSADAIYNQFVDNKFSCCWYFICDILCTFHCNRLCTTWVAIRRSLVQIC